MADLSECLKYAVGLAKNECACLDPDEGETFEDYNRSDSGYYLDDMEIAPSLQFPKAANECRTFWEMMKEAREQGIRDFITDFVSQSRMYTTIKMSPYDGEFVDNKKVNMVVTGINKQYLVAMYRPLRYVRGAVMEVKQIGLIMNMAGVYTLNVYKSTDLYSPEVTPVPVQTDTITVVTPGVLATTDLATAWSLPMWEDNQKVTYYFVYDPMGAKPYNLKFNCGCTNGTKPWESFITGKGIQTDDIARLEIDAQSHSTNSYGIYLKGSLTCDGFDWMCRDWNFKTDSFARVMARLIQLYSIRKLHALILNSSRINAYTLLKPEALQQRIIGISRMINDPALGNMPYLFRNIPRGVTGCWECESRAMKGSIIV